MNVQNQIQRVQSQLPEEVQRTGVTAISRSSGSGAVILTLYPESGDWTQLDLTNYGSIYILSLIHILLSKACRLE